VIQTYVDTKLQFPSP